MKDPGDLSKSRKDGGKNTGESSKDEDIRYLDIGTIHTEPKTKLAEYAITGKGLGSKARVTSDGRIVVSIDMKKALPDMPTGNAPDVEEFAVDKHEWRYVPKLNIVICIVGSRGDVQPYVALGKRFQKDGHRVRLGTHETFRKFVEEENGLEFFDIGGNPQDLMSYMVKNPGLIPGIETLTNGDIGKKRKMLAEMMHGCWNACQAPDPKTGQTFIADAIISNPPAFAHIHCAEALGVPLLMSFTMPWCSTTDFHHPLVNVLSSNAGSGLNNVLSYALFELVTWQGVGDLINDFRKETLGLRSLSLRTGPGILERVKVPWTYCMSPALIPKPEDWKNHIDVIGFYFLDLATNFKPNAELEAFLEAGEPPVYIGFGSVVVDDPKAMSKTIFEATKQAGVRALVSAGWGGLGGAEVPEHAFMLGNVPHDWLFSSDRVAAVVHHGGAGTAAIGLANGRPTVVVPFFGDQTFWGEMIHRAGAGPEPIPHKELNVQNLTEGIKFAISPAAKTAAQTMAEQIRSEDGVQQGVESFYRHLPLLNMRCDLDPQRVAVWWSTDLCLKISAFAAQVLVDARKLDLGTLDVHRSKEYNTRKKISDPVSGGSTAIFWTVTNYYAGIAQIFYSPVKGIVKTTTAIPRGIVDIVSSIYEGFSNMPRLYGSKVRKRGEVKDFSSGVNEGAKGLFYGYYDGITGLVTEPMEGAKKDGFMGAIKGAGRSYINATMRPAAGIVGMISNPITGAVKGVQTKFGRSKSIQKQESKTAKTRRADGEEEVRRSAKEERKAVLEAFERLSKQDAVKDRRQKWVKRAEVAFEEEKHEEEEDDTIHVASGSKGKKNSMGSPTKPTHTRTASSSYAASSSAAAVGPSFTPSDSESSDSINETEYHDASDGERGKGALNHKQRSKDQATDWDSAYQADLKRAHSESMDSFNSSRTNVGTQEGEDDSEAFLRDMEMAKKLSLDSR